MIALMRRTLARYRAHRAPHEPPPSERKAVLPERKAVLCIGCLDDCAMLDRVLEPGAYDISFLNSIDGAYAHILKARPSQVILCMRADDGQSLQLLSMLSLDPITTHIPVVTCIATAAGGSNMPLGSATEMSPACQVVMH